MRTSSGDKPLVSVIIPCYNQGYFLNKAIYSVIDQTYDNYEIIIVDDGSEDSTANVARLFDITYIYQPNQGLSSARNTGIAHSKGQYLVFLDADDWLYPSALEINLSYFNIMPQMALVSGAHQFFYAETQTTRDAVRVVEKNNYCQLLQCNYIAMIAAAMFKRSIFDEFEFDTSLACCEDYDLYLKIARKHSIYQHEKMIAVYHIHGHNISGKNALMLETALNVLSRQQNFLANDDEIACFESGKSFWREWYCTNIYQDLIDKISNHMAYDESEILVLKEYHKELYNKALNVQKRNNRFRWLIRFKPKLRSIFIKLFSNGSRANPMSGKVDMGNLGSLLPFSEQFGYDRGGPIDRYYIENFLEKHKGIIKGNVLEIGDNEYTLRYGDDRVKSSVLHVDNSNPKAHYVGDLRNCPDLPDNHFDCIILTQTLHLIYECGDAIATCYRVLKPGGSLILTVPGISHIAQDQWGAYWQWSFTTNSLSKTLSKCFKEGNTQLESFGNASIASAFLFGMGLPEVNKSQLDYNDVHYQVIITAITTK